MWCLQISRGGNIPSSKRCRGCVLGRPHHAAASGRVNAGGGGILVGGEVTSSFSFVGLAVVMAYGIMFSGCSTASVLTTLGEEGAIETVGGGT